MNNNVLVDGYSSSNLDKVYYETMYKESFANEGKRNLYSVVSNINELELLLEFKNIKLTRKNIVDNY